MSHYKKHSLIYGGEEKIIHVCKTTNENDEASIQIWFYVDGEEQVITFGFMSTELREKKWEAMDIEFVASTVRLFSGEKIVIDEQKCEEL